MTNAPNVNRDAPAATRQRSLAALFSGSGGYGTFVQQLKDYIVPEEATLAKQTFEKGHRAIKLALWAYVTVHLLATIVFLKILHSPNALAWHYDLERGALFVAAFLLASRWAVPQAGRILLLIGSFSFILRPPPGSFWPDLQLIELAEVTGGLFVAGWMLDIGAWQASPRARRPMRRLWLALAAAIFLGIVHARNEARQPLLFSTIAAVACLANAAWRARKRPQAMMPPDVELFHEAGWKRWSFSLTGRVFAILLGLFPFWFFLNHLDVETRFKAYAAPGKKVSTGETGSANAEHHLLRITNNFGGLVMTGPNGLIVTTDESKREQVWPWSEKGRLLCEEDFQRFHLYYADRDQCTSNQWNSIQQLSRALLVAPGNKETQTALEEALSTSRLTTAADFARVNPRNGAIALFCFPGEELHSESEQEAFTPQTLGGRKALIAAPLENVHKVITKLPPYKYAFLTFGIVGFVFLWRRGGDSRLARWIGIWLITLSISASLFTSDYFVFGAHFWFARQLCSADGTALVWAFRSLFGLLHVLSAALILAALCGVLQGIVWGLACAVPAPAKAGRYHWRYWRNLALSVIGNSAVVLSPLIVMRSGLKFGSPIEPDVHIACGLVISTVLALILGPWLRRKTRSHTEAPVFGFWPAIGFASANLTLASLLYYYDLPAGELARWVNACGLVCAATFVLSALVLTIKRDFLRVRAIRSFVTLFLVIVLPIALRMAEDKLHPLLNHTPFFSAVGSEMLLVLFAVWLLPHIHHFLEHLIRYFMDRKLHRIEHAVDNTLDAIVEAQPAEKQRHIAELFERLQISDYVFYSYRGGGKFSRDAGESKQRASAILELSDELRKFIGRQRGFIDLEASAYEWHSFFHLFDLNFLRQETGCRHLLPISVGDKLVALLFLPQGESTAESDDPGVTASLKNLGIGAVSRTGA